MSQFVDDASRTWTNPLGMVFVITDATRGDAKELALALAASGARLVLSASEDAALQQLAADCELLGGAAVGVAIDPARRGSLDSLVQFAVAEYGRLDVWIDTVPPPPRLAPRLAAMRRRRPPPLERSVGRS
jgi:NAD(P)-dependent dehydrogenase (short-subunit alcohol dehydrogenase family)